MKMLEKYFKPKKLTWLERFFRRNARFPTTRGNLKVVFRRDFSKKELEELRGPLYNYHKFLENQKPKFDIMDGRALL